MTTFNALFIFLACYAALLLIALAIARRGFYVRDKGVSRIGQAAKRSARTGEEVARTEFEAAAFCDSRAWIRGKVSIREGMDHKTEAR